MRKIIFLFLIILGLSVFYPRISDIVNPQKTQAFLKIESIPSEVNVFIDGQEVGVTPWESGKIETGIHNVRLVVNGLKWEGKVEVTAETETFVKRILGPGSFFSGGVIVSYQKTKNGTNNPGLAVTAKPEGVKVFVDNKEYEAPIVLEKISARKHKVSFALKGYLDDEVEVEIKSGFLANVDVEMGMNPFGKGEIGTVVMEGVVAEGTEEISEGTEDFKIVRRAEWNGGLPNISSKEFTLSSWQRIEVYPIFYSNFGWNKKIPETTELIRGMDFYAREFLNLPGLPFAYLITEDGKVYEGLGMRNFNFSEIENFQFSTGVCPIIYLSTSAAELSDAAKRSLTKLRNYLAGPPKQRAKLITVLNSIVIEPGKTREINLEFQNIGEVIWKSAGDKRVFLVTAPVRRASELYTKDSWIAVDTITLPKEENITLGQTAKFTFPISAPFYPDTIIESFGLLIEGTDQIIEGSEITLKIDVSAGNLVAVEIKDTPTGFLNVRNGPSTYAELIGTVYPGEKYLFLEEQSSWYKIKLRDGSEGWVYAKYAKKQD